MSRSLALLLVNGPWQAISLAATLRGCPSMVRDRDTLALLVEMPAGSSFHEKTRALLAANGIDRTLLVSSRALSAQAARVEAALGAPLEAVDTVVSYGVHRPIARFFCNRAPRASLVVYEDGLRAYVGEDRSVRGQLWQRVLKRPRVLGTALGNAHRDPRARGRAVDYALHLTRELGVPGALARHHVLAVPSAALAHVVERSSVRAEARPLRPFILLIGQYYSRLAQMTLSEEIRRYGEAAREIARRGFVPVWRGHPRGVDEHFELLRRECAELTSFADLASDPGWPLELHGELLRAACSGAVSFSSSSLFYLRALYGIPTYTLLDEQIVARMAHPHREGCAIALRHVPRFHAAS